MNDQSLAFAWYLLFAVLLESVVLIVVGYRGHWLAHSPTDRFLDDHFIEAQIFEPPKQVSVPALSSPHSQRHQTQTTISTRVHESASSSAAIPSSVEHNETTNVTSTPPTHGPVAVESPSPQIPADLRDRDLHTTVVVDFFILKTGLSTVRLVGSSGNEELDAVAVETAQKWRFLPAEKDHQAIDSKVRLRLIFKVQ